MKRSTTSCSAALLALSLLAASNAIGQDQEAIQKARKLRAEAAYQEMKGNREAALKSYQESLSFVKDAAIEKKISALSAPVAAPAAGGERAYAGEVYSRLDVGGEALVFLSPDNIVKPVREELKTVLNSVKEGMAGDNAMAGLFAEKFDSALEWLGLYSMHGFGLSLAQQGDGSYNYKEYLLGGEDRSGILWRLAGEPVPQDLLAYLPEQTATFAFSSVGIKTLWEIVFEGIEKFAGAPAKDAALQQVGGMRDATGVDVLAMVQSLEDQWAFAVTLNPATMISIPLPTGKALTLPEPGVLIAFDVKDGTIPTALRTFLEAQGTPLKETKVGDNTIYSFVLPEPLPVPVPFEPAMVLLNDDLLLIGLHPSALEAAMASKAAGGAMLQSADFKLAFANMPEKINAAFYMGKLFSSTIADVQKLVIETGLLGEIEAGGNAAAAQLVKRSLEKMTARKDNRLAMYSVSDADGVLAQGSIYSSGMNPIADGIVTPMGLLAGAAMHGAEKSRKSIADAGCRMNLNQIQFAKTVYQTDAEVAEGAEVDMEKLKDKIPDPLTCPNGGTYTIGKVGEKPTCTCGQVVD